MARYLSGIQPSGHLHLGNYFGAIRQHIANQHDAFYFIANYHALTTVNDAATLRDNTFDVAATYLALGLDPQRATLFLQSDVPEVAELTWLLSTVTGMGLLEKAVSYKEKRERGIHASVGLFTYPVLMAADILIYDSDVVPVGSDQVQHVELTRDMAGRFNQLYGETFKLPRHELGTPVPVPGLDGQKMSKSYGNHIPIFAEGKELKRLVGAITTDSKGLDEPKDPETCNVVALYKLFAAPDEVADMSAKYRAGGYGYGHAKQALIEKIDARFGAARARRAHYTAHPDEVQAALRAGAERARTIARGVLGRARRACGID